MNSDQLLGNWRWFFGRFDHVVLCFCRVFMRSFNVGLGCGVVIYTHKLGHFFMRLGGLLKVFSRLLMVLLRRCCR